jgi:hypothetical protein
MNCAPCPGAMKARAIKNLLFDNGLYKGYLIRNVNLIIMADGNQTRTFKPNNSKS